MQKINRQTTVTETKQPAEQQTRGPQPIDAALLRLISGGTDPGPGDETKSPKGGW